MVNILPLIVLCIIMRPLACNLKDNLKNWIKIGASPNVVKWIDEGVPLPFDSNPPVFEYTNKWVNREKQDFITNEIESLLTTGAISVSQVKPNCVSPITCIPKAKGSYRLIHDLRKVNDHCCAPKFSNEDIKEVKDYVSPRDVGITVDLKDGFHHVQIKEEFRTYLGFSWNEKYYHWNVLPFGLNIAPYYFYKVIRPVVQYLRSLGLKVVAYVDDFILLAIPGLITAHSDDLLHTLLDLGLSINCDKSVLIPSSEIDFIGYVLFLDLDHPVICVQNSRLKKLKRCLRQLLTSENITARRLARIAGQCVSMSKVIVPAKLLLREVYRVLASHQGWDSLVVLTPPARVELQWWLHHVENWNSNPIVVRPYQIQIITDASHLGWGAVLNNQEASGQWNVRMSNQSSNHRELMAILMALKSFHNQLVNKSVHILTDNITSLAYVNNMGGPSRELSHITKAIWSLALNSNMHIHCNHISGIKNLHADYLSRIFDRYNWMLHPNLFKVIDSVWGKHTVDRFASCTNTQLPRFNSRFMEPHSEGIDALAQQNWQSENNFVNPPFRLLSRVLDVIEAQGATATIIAPKWIAQPWFSRLKSMSISSPLKLPNVPNSFRFMGPYPEPLRNRKWKIFAWRVCGKTP